MAVAESVMHSAENPSCTEPVELLQALSGGVRLAAAAAAELQDCGVMHKDLPVLVAACGVSLWLCTGRHVLHPSSTQALLTGSLLAG